MLKILHKGFRQHFPEILKMISEWAEQFFGLELKEVKRCWGTYTIVKNLDDSHCGSSISDLDIPMNGLLMPLLGVIFLNGKSVSEDEVWEFLKMIAIYGRNKCIIFGEPCKFITKDLVQKNYLVYRKVLHSDPPRFEYLWGPRAHTEISKMKVLEFLAKVNETIPSAFPLHYAQVLREEGRTQAKVSDCSASCIPHPRETSNTSTLM
ncbi:melanoma-associated antigen B2-like [Cavia porcellus]|uniref:melanoma-associated antigen B2-like n=1 Tax=Cavia porcellus TaxID=10141 RepID=UPI002FE05BD6